MYIKSRSCGHRLPLFFYLVRVGVHIAQIQLKQTFHITIFSLLFPFVVFFCLFNGKNGKVFTRKKEKQNMGGGKFPMLFSLLVKQTQKCMHSFLIIIRFCFSFFFFIHMAIFSRGNFMVRNEFYRWRGNTKTY